MVSHKVRIVRLFLVVNNHCLNIRKHVLALPKATIFHLAFLNTLHADSLFNQVDAAPVFFITASGLATDVLIAVVSIDELAHASVMVTVLSVADSDMALRTFFRIMFALLLLFFFTAVVAAIALAQLLSLEISMVLIS